MNKKLELFSVGTFSALFGAFLIYKEGAGVYSLLLILVGIGLLGYTFFKRNQINDFDNPEKYDERDALIQNKASNIILKILLYTMMMILLLNTFVIVPLNYAFVLLILFATVGKLLVIKIVEKCDDNQ